ncbi:retinol-binding protein pinta-like [Bacillus rossius redtenbacheri]|uniref:retinol-binding protein pinta-like n=1 Tax=Bacillus rossius redtenbacheri TaxID=93214 RepID=UPI002FDD49D9
MDTNNKTAFISTNTEEEKEKIMENVGITFDEIYCRGSSLVEWTYVQPHLPNVRENYYKYSGFAGKLWFRMKMSMARAKNKIDTYYTMKALAPEYLLNRDPANQQLRASMAHLHIAPMPMLTDRLTRVYAIKFVDREFSPHMLTDWNKYVLMLGDVQQWDDLSLAEEVVVDMANLTLKQVVVLTPPVVKKLVKCYLDVLLFKPLSMHFVNAPSFAEAVFTLVKSLLKPKIADRIFVHTEKGYEKLHEHISPKYLPKDFDGEGPELKDMHNAWLQKIDSYREWFLENDSYVVREELRQGTPISYSDVFGMKVPATTDSMTSHGESER